jgi:hypothetical protein
MEGPGCVHAPEGPWPSLTDRVQATPMGGVCFRHEGYACEASCAAVELHKQKGPTFEG